VGQGVLGVGCVVEITGGVLLVLVVLIIMSPGLTSRSAVPPAPGTPSDTEPETLFVSRIIVGEPLLLEG
jgi:hypothetical protein